MSDYEFRAIDPSEVNLVLDSWARSFRNSDYAGTVPNHLWYPTVRETVASLISRGAKLEAVVVGGRVWAWLCYEHKPSGDATDVVLHYGYTKDPFRRQGLMRQLVARALDSCAGSVFYTHRTRHSRYMVPKSAIFAPEIARRKAL